MPLDEMLQQVRSFHRRVGAPVSESPCLIPGNRTEAARLGSQLLTLSTATANLGASSNDLLLCRTAMLLDEVAEWLFAHAAGNLAVAADAWADHLYVLLGDAVTAGLPGDRLFAEIHQANLTKQIGQLSWTGQAVKGPDFQPPEVGHLLERRGTR